MSPPLLASWSEALMLACFGLAWPVATVRLLRDDRSDGRGIGFTALILLGYIAGATAKLLSVDAAASLPPVFWLYLLNACSVFLHLALQGILGARCRQRDRHVTGDPRPGREPGRDAKQGLAAARVS